MHLSNDPSPHTHADTQNPSIINMLSHTLMDVTQTPASCGRHDGHVSVQTAALRYSFRMDLHKFQCRKQLASVQTAACRSPCLIYLVYLGNYTFPLVAPVCLNCGGFDWGEIFIYINICSVHNSHNVLAVFSDKCSKHLQCCFLPGVYITVTLAQCETRPGTSPHIPIVPFPESASDSIIHIYIYIYSKTKTKTGTQLS